MQTISYIGGYGRSGSTITAHWLQQIAEQSGDTVVNMGELGAHIRDGTWKAMKCGCGELLGDCTYWSAGRVAAESKFQRRAATFLQSFPGLAVPLVVLRWATSKFGLFETETAIALGSNRIIDSSKTGWRVVNRPRIWKALGFDVELFLPTRPFRSIVDSRVSAFRRSGRSSVPAAKIAIRTFAGVTLSRMGAALVRPEKRTRLRYDDRPAFCVLRAQLGLESEPMSGELANVHSAGGNRTRTQIGAQSV